MLNDKLLVANAGCNSLTVVDVNDMKITDIICLDKLMYDSNYITFNREVPFYRTHCMAVNKERSFLYLVNSFDDSIFKVDLIKKKIINAIYAGSNPSHIQLLDDLIIVTNSDSNSISIIDENSFTLVENISVGIKPHDIKVDENTNKIYVSNSNGFSLNVISLYDDNIETIKLNTHPLHLYILNNFMYILSSQTNGMNCSYITKLDLKTHKVIKSIPIDEIILDMTIINDNLLFTTNVSNGYIYKINNFSNKQTEKYFIGGMPTSIIWDEKNYLYITDIERDLLIVFDTIKSKVIKTIKVGEEPSALLLIKKDK